MKKLITLLILITATLNAQKTSEVISIQPANQVKTRETKDVVIQGMAYNKANLEVCIMVAYWRALSFRSIDFEANANVIKYDSETLIVNIPFKTDFDSGSKDILISIRITGDSSELKLEWMIESNKQLSKEEVSAYWDATKNDFVDKFHDQDGMNTFFNNFNQTNSPMTLNDYLLAWAKLTKKPHWMTSKKEVIQFFGANYKQRETVENIDDEFIDVLIMNYEKEFETSTDYSISVLNIYLNDAGFVVKSELNEY